MQMCIACGSHKNSSLLSSEYISCRSCRSVYAVRSFSEKELQRHYFNYYGDENTQLSQATLFRYREIVGYLNKYRSKLNSILEIGCGSGELLMECQSNGWKVAGTEISESALKILREKNLDVIELAFTSEAFVEQFDAILLFEVVEHVKFPQDLLEFCFKSLRPGGLLIGTTPNALSLNSKILGVRWSIYGLPEHLCIFAPKALRKVCENIGFSKTSIVTRGFNPFDIMKYYLRSSKFRRVKKFSQSRVELGIQLNEMTFQSKVLSKIKFIVNKVFQIWHVGDSIEFKIVK